MKPKYEFTVTLKDEQELHKLHNLLIKNKTNEEVYLRVLGRVEHLIDLSKQPLFLILQEKSDEIQGFEFKVRV